jgi:hypothetical protein
VRHADHHAPSSSSRGARDRLVEHRDENIDAFDGEALRIHIRAAEEALQSSHFAEALEQRGALVRRERRGDLTVANDLTEPFALVLLAEVIELEADAAAVQIAQLCDDVGRRAARIVADGDAGS